MNETSEPMRTAHAKDEFFSADMYMFHVTGFPQQPAVRTSKVEAPQGARLDVWRTDPASDRHIPGPGAEGVAFGTQGFSLINSGNRTLHAPKRSWKVTLEHGAGRPRRDDVRQSQVDVQRSLADAGGAGLAPVPARGRSRGAAHLCQLAFDTTYYGLFSVIEQVDKRFLEDHFGGNHRGNLYKAYCGDVGCATLEHRTGPDGDDSGRQYYKAADDDRTYRLKTNEDDPGANSYDDLAQFIRTISGTRIGGGDGRFGTDAFRESVDGIMNARAFLRWAAVNLLLGSWDNYYATPSNYYLYNSGRLGAADDFMGSPYFTFVPWDYDNCLGIDYFGTKWQYTDILDWPANTRRYWREHATSRIPLVQNLLATATTVSITWITLKPARYRVRPDAFGQQIAATPATACGAASARPLTWSRPPPTASRSPAANSPTMRSTSAAASRTNSGTGRKRPRASSITSACGTTAHASSWSSCGRRRRAPSTRRASRPRWNHCRRSCEQAPPWAPRTPRCGSSSW